MRIIGGRWRRRRIPIPAVDELRPTPDRVRETLFNWLAPVLPGAVCLDLYAGTGALGFEALSRGAARAVFVESNPVSADALGRLRDELEAPAEVVCAEALDYLRKTRDGPFDIVFVDPPYAESVDAVLEAVGERLGSGACVYVERARGDRWPELPVLAWSRRANAGAVSFGLAETAPV